MYICLCIPHLQGLSAIIITLLGLSRWDNARLPFHLMKINKCVQPNPFNFGGGEEIKNTEM